MSPAKRDEHRSLGHTKLELANVARIVDRNIAYARYQLKHSAEIQSRFERLSFLHASLAYLNSALLAYGAEIAVSNGQPLIDDNVWMLFSRYKQTYGKQKSDAILSELTSLEADADSWLTTIESACTQLALRHSLLSVSAGFNNSLLQHKQEFNKQESNNLNKQTLIVSSNTAIDIYSSPEALSELLGQTFSILELLIERQRSLNTEC